MMIKVITIVFIYFLLGTITLSIMAAYDRISDDTIPMLDIQDNGEVAMVVLLWPLFVSLAVLYVIFVWIPAKLAKGIMTIVTAIIYTIKALSDKDN